MITPLVMRSEPTEAFATRLPASEAALLEEVKEEKSWTNATLLRRAIRYYADENPDHIDALYSDDSLDRFVRELVE